MQCEEPTVQVPDPRVSLSQVSKGQTVINASVNPPLWVLRGGPDPDDASKILGTELVSADVVSYDKDQAAFIQKDLYGTTTPPD